MIPQQLTVADLMARISTLEDQLEFLERWCEELQDALDTVTTPLAVCDDGPGRGPRLLDLRRRPSGTRAGRRAP